MYWTKGDIIDVANEYHACAIAFTANATVNSLGALVMGHGAALRMKNQFHGLDLTLGTAISGGGKSLGMRVCDDYHLAEANVDGRLVLAVQVKRFYRDHTDPAAKAACFELTRRSLLKLRAWSLDNDLPVAVNCPLIGAGGYTSREEKDRVYRMVAQALGGTRVFVCTL